LEPIMGGELFTVYQRYNLYGQNDCARFHTACTVRGLQYLHSLYIMYRDLKSENVLLDHNGYCKITDFGLSKFSIGSSFTMCGTPEYFAPEMVAACGHTIAIDWWTLGILIFELMTSDTPFSAADSLRIFHKVKHGISLVHFPSDDPWTDLVRSLCQTEPSERLCMRKNGIKLLEMHSWYSAVGFNWALLDARTMQPPYLPRVKSVKDTGNFDVNSGDVPEQLPYVDPGTGWDKEFEDPVGPKSFN